MKQLQHIRSCMQKTHPRHTAWHKYKQNNFNWPAETHGWPGREPDDDPRCTVRGWSRFSANRQRCRSAARPPLGRRTPGIKQRARRGFALQINISRCYRLGKLSYLLGRGLMHTGQACKHGFLGKPNVSSARAANRCAHRGFVLQIDRSWWHATGEPRRALGGWWVSSRISHFIKSHAFSQSQGKRAGCPQIEQIPWNSLSTPCRHLKYKRCSWKSSPPYEYFACLQRMLANHRWSCRPWTADNREKVQNISRHHLGSRIQPRSQKRVGVNPWYGYHATFMRGRLDNNVDWRILMRIEEICNFILFDNMHANLSGRLRKWANHLYSIYSIAVHMGPNSWSIFTRFYACSITIYHARPHFSVFITSCQLFARQQHGSMAAAWFSLVSIYVSIAQVVHVSILKLA